MLFYNIKKALLEIRCGYRTDKDLESILENIHRLREQDLLTPHEAQDLIIECESLMR